MELLVGARPSSLRLSSQGRPLPTLQVLRPQWARWFDRVRRSDLNLVKWKYQLPIFNVRQDFGQRQESLYESGALALQQFRRSDWSREASLDTGTLRVEVCESTFYNVKVAELEAWLKRTGGAPRDVIARQRVQSKLAGDATRKAGS